MDTPVRVMIVDDNADMRIMVATYLRSDPNLTVVASVDSAAAAMDALEQDEPAVAIVDVRLGVESGVDLCRAIRERSPAVHCLIFSGWMDSRADEGFLQAGASAVVRKGEPLQDLAQRVLEIAASEPPPLSE